MASVISGGRPILKNAAHELRTTTVHPVTRDSKIWKIIQKHVVKNPFFFACRISRGSSSQNFSRYFHSLSRSFKLHSLHTTAVANGEMSFDTVKLNVIYSRANSSSLRSDFHFRRSKTRITHFSVDHQEHALLLIKSPTQ